LDYSILSRTDKNHAKNLPNCLHVSVFPCIHSTNRRQKQSQNAPAFCCIPGKIYRFNRVIRKTPELFDPAAAYRIAGGRV
jgi:hypothetical protein